MRSIQNPRIHFHGTPTSTFRILVFFVGAKNGHAWSYNPMEPTRKSANHSNPPGPLHDRHKREPKHHMLAWKKGTSLIHTNILNPGTKRNQKILSPHGTPTRQAFTPHQNSNKPKTLGPPFRFLRRPILQGPSATFSGPVFHIKRKSHKPKSIEKGPCDPPETCQPCGQRPLASPKASPKRRPRALWPRLLRKSGAAVGAASLRQRTESCDLQAGPGVVHCGVKNNNMCLS